MAIALPDELQEREGPSTNRALTGLWRPCVAGLWQVCGSSATFLQIIARADMP